MVHPVMCSRAVLSVSFWFSWQWWLSYRSWRSWAVVEPYWRSSASSVVCTQMRHFVPSGVSAISISLFNFCVLMLFGVLRLAWVSGGLNASYFVEGVRYVRPRERWDSRGSTPAKGGVGNSGRGG